MLPARHRMRQSRDFTRAVRRGRRTRRRTLMGYLAQSDQSTADSNPGGTSPPRVGFVVGRTVGHAVSRNEVRRRLRHLMRDRISLLPAGGLFVVRAQSGTATLTYHELGRALDELLDRLLRDDRPRGGPARAREGHR